MEELAMNREQRIQHAMDFLCDIIPHNDPNYWESLRAAAENYVDWEDDGCPVMETDWIDEITNEDFELPF